MNSNTRRQPCVYGLRAGSVYGYVGSTTINTDMRLWQHRSKAKAGHASPVYEWMRTAGIKNVEIVMLDPDPSAEADWILRLLNAGHPLMNQKGRDGIINSMSADSKAKISAANKGKPTWIKGKTGDDAGWTQARKEAMRK